MTMTPQIWPWHHTDMAMTPQTWPWHHRHGHDTTQTWHHRHDHDTTHTWPWHNKHRWPDMSALAMTPQTWPWQHKHILPHTTRHAGLGHDTTDMAMTLKTQIITHNQTCRPWPWHHRDRDYQTQNGRAQGQTSFKHKFLTIKQKNCNGCIFQFHSHW